MHKETLHNTMAGSPIIPFRRHQLWGVCDTNGTLLMPCEFAFAYMPAQTVDGGWLIFTKNQQQQFGWVLWQGEQLSVVQPQFFDVDLNSLLPNTYDDFAPLCPTSLLNPPIQLIAVRAAATGGLGYVNLAGEAISTSHFQHAEPFFGKSAAVSVKDSFGVVRWGLIDNDGNWLLEPKYGLISRPFEGLRLYRQHLNGLGVRYGYLDADTGQVVVASTLLNAKGFCGGLAVAQLAKGDSGFALINRQGDVILDNLASAKACVNGMIAVKQGRKWGVVNAQGATLLPFNYSDAGEPLGDRLALKKGKWGFVDLTTPALNLVVSHQYKNVSDAGFVEGLCCVQDFEDRIYHINQSGQQQTPYNFSDLMDDFCQSRCLVMAYEDNLHGYIDTNGTLIIPRKYQLAFPFEVSGLAAVVSALNKKDDYTGKGHIDRDGQQFWRD
jgi:WG containing repeat